MKQRQAGVLMPISALPGGYGVGSFGRAAYAFVDILEECGFRLWQTLPFSTADQYNSPYASASSFSLNPFFVDVEALKQEGLLTEKELEGAKERVSHTAEYARLSQERIALLSLAAERFEEERRLERFLAEHPYIEEYCRFEGLKVANGGAQWRFFETKEPNAAVYRTYAFISYVFWEQWSRLHAYANAHGVAVVGDLPIYVSYESADVFFHSHLFDLTAELLPRGVAGVPPDYFSEDGQMWGNPLYRWDRMAAENFSFWRARIRHMLTLFDGVRLDHFRGFDSYFDIPAHAKTAKEGRWREGPRYPFVDMLKEEAGDRLLIAEDLGERSAGVEDLLRYSGFPGMRVFAFALDGEDSPHLPYRYPSHTVAYTGTHDNNTLLGFLMSLPEERRIACFRYCHYQGEKIEEGCRAVLETLYASHADRVVFPIQDLLLFGEDTRFNTPGSAEGNWAFRVTEEQLHAVDQEYFHTLACRYGRA